MIEFPEIKRKARKVPFRKSEAVKELERLANIEARNLHPTIDSRFIAPRIFRDDSANSLTSCIVKYITLCGGFASRINSTGIYRPQLGKYTPGTQKRGIADIMATFRGLSLHIEVKIGKDQQSEAQKRVEAEVNRSGGRYFIARDFESFYKWFKELEKNE